MLRCFKNPAQIVTVGTEGKNEKRGKSLNDIGILEDFSVITEDNIIKDFIKTSRVTDTDYDEVVDISDKVLLPGIVECHTHTAYAGSRANEFKMKLKGVSYEEIAKMGGGINSTVQAIRETPFDTLVNIIKSRIEYFISQGVTSLEIKSGYGLSYYDEIKLLKAVQHCKKIMEIDIIPSFLGAHTFPPEYKNDHQKYISIICDEMLPYIAQNNLAHFCDGFCENTAFSVDELDRIFNKAKEYGLKVKLHTDQFNSIGGLDLAIKHKAVSVDHLEVVNTEDIQKLSGSDLVVVLLPGCSFFLNYDYAPARDLIDNEVLVALSTDYNPGSSHIANISLIMGLAALKMKLSIEEIISSYTINAAKALDINTHVGSVEIGKNADFSILNSNNYADLVYQLGKNINYMTVKNGKIIYKVP